LGANFHPASLSSSKQVVVVSANMPRRLIRGVVGSKEMGKGCVGHKALRLLSSSTGVANTLSLETRGGELHWARRGGEGTLLAVTTVMLVINIKNKELAGAPCSHTPSSLHAISYTLVNILRSCVMWHLHLVVGSSEWWSTRS